ncbi:MAG: hypothetical protein ACKVT2_07370 [Saprospiraceae bacterium]
MIGYKENGGDCFSIPFFGFYIISSEPFNPNGVVLDLNGVSGACNTTLLEDIYQPCDNGSSAYAAVYNNWPYCQHTAPSGTITFQDGTVCQYVNGLSSGLAECLDFVEDCKDPLIEFAQDFVSASADCKLWEGPCAVESEIWRLGDVNIGSVVSLDGYKLGVKGGITTEMLQICKAEWCDYVFSDSFRLMPLEEVNSFIQKNGHLPNCTPAGKVAQDGGFLLAEETISQQEKIEEIFLHLIQSQKRLDDLSDRLSKVAPDLGDPVVPEPLYFGEEYPQKYTDLLQIECFQIKPAPGGIGGVIVSPDNGPYTISWTGPSNGSIHNMPCTEGAIQIQNLSAGVYYVMVSNASGNLGTCSFSILPGGSSVDCEIFSDPYCKQAILEMLELEAFGTPSNCTQWEGDPCSHEENIFRLGNVGIGTSVGRAGYSLAVKGGIVTDKFRVELCESQGWCDYVFDEGYPLLTLSEIASHIKAHKRLPGTVSQNEVTEVGGFEVRSVKLDHQKKIEEAYLHLIALNKKKEALKSEINDFYNN